MKTETSKRVIIKIASQDQQENTLNSRKGLKVLQQSSGVGKENLVGRSRMVEKEKEQDKPDLKRKRLMHSKSVQVGECLITEDDLVGDEPSEDYWRLLAEKRGAALNDSFKENEKLKDQVDLLKEENKVCKEMLDESKHLIEVLQEMISEDEESARVDETETSGVED